MNPHSTGGIYMVQKWDDRVKERIYEELKDKFIKKDIPEGWGDCYTETIK